MHKNKTKPAGDTRPKSIKNQLNNSIYELASHLCSYTDVLKQFSVRPGTR